MSFNFCSCGSAYNTLSPMRCTIEHVTDAADAQHQTSGQLLFDNLCCHGHSKLLIRH